MERRLLLERKRREDAERRQQEEEMERILEENRRKVEEAQRKAAEAAAEQHGLPKPGAPPLRPKRQVGAKGGFKVCCTCWLWLWRTQLLRMRRLICELGNLLAGAGHCGRLRKRAAASTCAHGPGTCAAGSD